MRKCLDGGHETAICIVVEIKRKTSCKGISTFTHAYSSTTSQTTYCNTPSQGAIAKPRPHDTKETRTQQYHDIFTLCSQNN